MARYKQARIEIVDGVEGMSLYINDERVAGPKPWGGGPTIKTFTADANRIAEALGLKPNAQS